MNVIEVENLVKVFSARKNPVLAVENVSFHVKQGEIFGLLGPNGAGKTTTVRILTTILQSTSGTARILGHDVNKVPLKVREQIAVVLQETAIETLLSVQDNLTIYGLMHGLSRKDTHRRMENVLEQFGLLEKQKEKAQDLSLGLRRRLQVAKVFMVDSPILFLDEATTGMDPIIKRQTLEAIRDLARNGKTILLTTQLLEEAEALCDHIVIMNKGKTIASGNLDKLRTLTTKRFHVSLDFSEAWPGAMEAVRNLNPVNIKIEDRTVEMTFNGEEATLLEHLAALSTRWKIERFEIRGADLEDIFVELIEE
jgi:ABC-type multidrug transport system ATPase subunit